MINVLLYKMFHEFVWLYLVKWIQLIATTIQALIGAAAVDEGGGKKSYWIVQFYK